MRERERKIHIQENLKGWRTLVNFPKNTYIYNYLLTAILWLQLAAADGRAAADVHSMNAQLGMVRAEPSEEGSSFRFAIADIQIYNFKCNSLGWLFPN